MGPAAQKILGWIGLFTGVGGTALFFLLVATHRPPAWPTAWWLWPVLTAVLAVIAGCILARAYRRAPPPGRGFCHLRLSDLVVGMLFCGSVMGGGQVAMGPKGLLWAVPLAFACSIALTIGFIVSEGMELSAWRRYVLSFGLVPLSLGALAVGAWVALLVALLIDEGDPGRALESMARFLFSRSRTSDLPARALEAGICCAPVGTLLCWLALRGRARPIAEPSDPTAPHRLENK